MLPTELTCDIRSFAVIQNSWKVKSYALYLLSAFILKLTDEFRLALFYICMKCQMTSDPCAKYVPMTPAYLLSVN